MDQRARDGGALLFAAAELMHEMRRALRHSDQLEQLARTRLALAMRHALQQQRKADVLDHVHRRQQIEELEDEAEPVPAVIGQRRIVRCMQREPVDEDLAARRRIEAGEQMHERALAAAARAGDRDEFAARDLERDAVERMHGALAAPIMAGDVAERDQACLIRQRREARKPAADFRIVAETTITRSSTSRRSCSCIRRNRTARARFGTSCGTLLAFEIANGGQVSIVNRLDRETSGLVLVAKTAAAARTVRPADAATADREGISRDRLGLAGMGDDDSRRAARAARARTAVARSI